MNGVVQGSQRRAPVSAEQARKRKAAEMIERDRVRLIARQPFLASLAMRMEVVPVVDSRVTTAATDGHSLFFDADFMLGLSEDERLFVMAHEVWHCAALHFPRRGNRDPERWNVAIDHETNNLLKEQGMTIPRGAIWFSQLAGRNAEVVYARLEGADEDALNRAPFDDVHDPGETMLRADPGGKSGQDEVIVDPDFRPVRGSDTWKRWPRSVHAAAQQACRTRGNEPGWLRKLLQLHGAPVLPWHSVLRRFVEKARTGSYHWTPPNRRYLGQGMILPARFGERLRLAVAIDCSGSTGPVIGVFLRELRGILDSYGRYEVRVLACDTQIRLDERWSNERPVPSRIDLPADGGSDMRPVFQRLASEPPAALVFLTDGDVRVPERTPNWPVLWCLPESGIAPARWGGTVLLPADRGSEAPIEEFRLER